MFNCFLVIRNSERAAYFKTRDAAEMYVSIMRGIFSHLDIDWEVEGSYVDGLYW